MIKRYITATGLLLLAWSLSGCGQKGPLYLPKPEAESNKAAAPPTQSDDDPELREH